MSYVHAKIYILETFREKRKSLMKQIIVIINITRNVVNF